MSEENVPNTVAIVSAGPTEAETAAEIAEEGTGFSEQYVEMAYYDAVQAIEYIRRVQGDVPELMRIRMLLARLQERRRQR